MTDKRLEEIKAILNEAPTLVYLYVPANELVLEVERLRAENSALKRRREPEPYQFPGGDEYDR